MTATLRQVSFCQVSMALQEPSARLATIEAAGHASVPYTSGLLIGIGETRDERLQALLQLRDLHRQHGHIQVQHSPFLILAFVRCS